MPQTGEVVVFKDFFTAGLRILMDPVVPKLLEPFNVKLHHFTPKQDSSVVQIFMGCKVIRMLSIRCFLQALSVALSASEGFCG